MRVLVANVGSTSFKYRLIDTDSEQVLVEGKVERIGEKTSPLTHQFSGHEKHQEQIYAPTHSEAIHRVLELLGEPGKGVIDSLQDLAAVGFKTVHAGPLTGALLVDEEVISAMESYSSVAPAHNPPYITAMRIFQQLAPGVPLVAHFETLFHRDMPDYAYTYSVPYEWYEQYGVRRYGFHGASLRYVSDRVPELLGMPREGLRLVACHLGGSSSVCAIVGGRSIDTSMGFALQSGVPMASRSGDIDPFIIPYMMEKAGMTMDEVKSALTKRGGLLGISGLSADVRDLENAAHEGHYRARLALETFAYQVRKYIGAYAAAMGGIDALAFAGGIGENGSEMRARICRGLEFLGIRLLPERNDGCRATEMVISAPDSQVKVLVVPTNEELIVAKAAARVVAEQQQASRGEPHTGSGL